MWSHTESIAVEIVFQDSYPKSTTEIRFLEHQHTKGVVYLPEIVAASPVKRWIDHQHTWATSRKHQTNALLQPATATTSEWDPTRYESCWTYTCCAAGRMTLNNIRRRMRTKCINKFRRSMKFKCSIFFLNHYIHSLFQYFLNEHIIFKII